MSIYTSYAIAILSVCHTNNENPKFKICKYSISVSDQVPIPWEFLKAGYRSRVGCIVGHQLVSYSIHNQLNGEEEEVGHHFEEFELLIHTQLSESEMTKRNIFLPIVISFQWACSDQNKLFMPKF
jgi:hypothetical protein